ncbi:histidine triad nucleotide-binding protein [Patescibacteria group bacterium]|nr:histidine triad nucleotide-binding protein [Patescibacteria group bacterium]
MNDCIFCKIINNEIPSEAVLNTDDFMVVKDIAPKAPIHLLILPKKHILSLAEIEEGDQLLTGKMLYITKKLASKFGLTERGFKIVINTGPDGGQLVPHLHFHFLGGKKMAELA